MTRIAAKRGRIYLDMTANGAGTAAPLPFVSSWSLNFSTEKIDVTAMGDEGMVAVSGMPEQTGELSGFYDDSTSQTYLAAGDGVARKSYFYPTTDNTAQYWFGTCVFDFSVSGAANGAWEMSSNFSAATKINKVG